jgi:hypothetical protein
VAYQHHPSTRDAGLARVAALTTALSIAGVVATGGVAAGIAAAAANPKSASADYTGGKTTVPAGKGSGAGSGATGSASTGATGATGSGGSASTGVTPPNDRPESSTGDEQTTSGGS